MAKKNGAAVWDEVIEELNDVAGTLKTGGLKALAGKYRVTRLASSEIPTVGPDTVKAVREKVMATQPTFASLLGVSPQTLRAWELGSKKPSSTARRFLQEIARDPKYWRRRLDELAELSAGSRA